MERTRDRHQVDMLEGSILKPLLIFAVPIFISYLFQQMYSTVDTMVVGHYLGENSLAAIGSSTTIYDLMMTFSIGVGNGMSVVIARCFGSGDEDQLKKSAASAVLIAAGISLIMMAVSMLIAGPLLKVINTPQDIMSEAESYIGTLTWFIWITVFYNLLSGMLRAIGNSVMPLVFLIISSCLNVGLDLFLVTVLGMGIRGAAIATGIAQTVSVVLCVFYIRMRVRLLIPEKKHFVFDGELVSDMLAQGIAMGLMNSVVSTATLILQYGINGMGEIVIAGHTTARKMIFMVDIPFFSLSQASMTFVSQNKGAGNALRVRKAMRLIILLNILLCIIITAVIWPTAPFLAGLISGSDNEVLIANCSSYVRIGTAFSAILGTLLTIRVSLQGLGEKVLPLVASIMELIGKILFTVFLVPVFAYNAIIWCEPVIWCFMLAELLAAFYRNPFIRGTKEKIKKTKGRELKNVHGADH